MFDGTRVSKADRRMEACGDVDELAAWIGLVQAGPLDEDLREMLSRVQRDLFAMGALLADPRGRIAPRVQKASLASEDVARLEAWIDTLQREVPPLRRFLLPGGAERAAFLHLARTVCRRAERRVVALDAGEGPSAPAGRRLDPVVLAYVNRLSDLLFVMARAVNVRLGAVEIEW